MHSPAASSDAPISSFRPTVVQQAVALVICLALSYGAAAIGGAITASSVQTWYQTLNKPAWNPPDWIFGPVWTLLYGLMAVAAWLVWRRGGWMPARVALTLFGIQLVLNVAWSGLFFGLRRPDFALVDIVALWLSIVATSIAFWRHSPVAAVLFLPYLAWTSFAALLNFTIWQLNA